MGDHGRSPSQAPPSRDYLEFAVRISSSRFKRAFAELLPGDPVAITPPRGHFPCATDRPAIFVATGIGITPLKSMAEYAHDLNLKTPIVPLYGNSSPEEIAFRAQLDALQAANPYFKVVYTVSHPDRAWQGRVGRITSDLLQEAAEQYDQPLFYLAGPPSMVVRSHETLIELGFEPEPGPKEVIIKVRAIGVNRNDLWAREGLPGMRFNFPHISGSNLAGEVVSLGTAVGSVSVGMQVAVHPSLSCRICEQCTAGHEYFCREFKIYGFQTGPLDGGYAEYERLPEANVIPKPRARTFEQGEESHA